MHQLRFFIAHFSIFHKSLFSICKSFCKLYQFREIKQRKEKQPLEYPNAGSTFKRNEKFITAKLIDECGLKGYSVGGAQVSEKHAGFVINKDNATFSDVMSVIEDVRRIVKEKTGYILECEPVIISDKI